MLAELAANSATVANTFIEAGEALGFDLWTLVAEGPKEQLDRTAYTQPAMLAAWRSTSLRPIVKPAPVPPP